MIDKTYSKKFKFGKVAEYSKTKRNEVELEVELKIEDNKTRFSASGNLWNGSHTDILWGGQCIDDIYDKFKSEIKERKTYEAIMALWEKWHLNDMNPGCEHQRKWKSKKVSIVKLKLDWETTASKQKELEDKIMKTVKEHGSISISEGEQGLLNLPYWITVPLRDVEKYPQYKIESTEVKETSWLHPSEHPEGYLGKACGYCGYKYGTSWVYNPITKKDLREILQLLKVDASETSRIITLGA
jgi:predicted small metal-binding protein